MPSLSRPIILSFALFALSFGAFAQSPSPGDIGSQVRFKVEKYKLANGLTVLLHEDHSAPLVSYQTWFRVGSKDEEPGLTGIAHLFEHMMFKGAKRYSGEQFDTILQANGATNNAFTTNDYTGYYENLPSAKLELVIDIESDRMESLKIDGENLRTERDVVKEERGFRVDNNPAGLLREALFSTAFKVHPYKWPVIGYMKDLDNVTVEIAQNFHRTYYAPNNAVVVVAGDFKTDEAKKLIEKYYGAIKSQPIPKKTRPAEPAQVSPRSQFLSKDVQNVQFVISYHSPKSGSEEAYALDLLANILGAGSSSRFYQRLVYKDQIATSAGAYNLTMQEAGMFEVMVSLKPGGDFGRAQRAIYGELWRPRNVLVSEEELQKAKNQVMKSYVDGLKTIHGKAEALALNEILYDDYEQLFKDLDRYNKVTADQIKKAATKYLAPERSTLVVLRPTGGKNKKKRGN
ncbi:MAG: pitrilysin family protein [Bdellovibrionota bacterium]